MCLHGISTATLLDKHYHLSFGDEDVEPERDWGFPQGFRIRATFELDLGAPRVHVLALAPFDNLSTTRLDAPKLVKRNYLLDFCFVWRSHDGERRGQEEVVQSVLDEFKEKGCCQWGSWVGRRWEGAISYQMRDAVQALGYTSQLGWCAENLCWGWMRLPRRLISVQLY